MGKATGTKLTWPAGLPKTPAALEWFRRLAALPPGLTLRAAADRLRRPYGLVRAWVRRFGYPAAGGWHAKADWDAVDWSQSDAAIARALGVGRERVGQQRRKRGLPPSRRPPPPAGPFRAWVAARRPGELDGRTVADVVAASGCRVSLYTAAKALRAAGVRPARELGPRTYPPMDWRLNNAALAGIWGTYPPSVARKRKETGGPPARWDGRRNDLDADPDYRRAVAAERKRAAAWRAGRRGRDCET